MLREMINQHVTDMSQQQDSIVSTIISQGYKYLIMKIETNYDFNNNKVTTNYTYHGWHDNELPELYKQAGYQLYDLSEYIKYLEGRVSVTSDKFSCNVSNIKL